MKLNPCQVYNPALFSHQSSNTDRGTQGRVLSTAGDYRLGGLGNWNGAGNGAHHNVTPSLWSAQGQVFRPYHAAG